MLRYNIEDKLFGMLLNFKHGSVGIFQTKGASAGREWTEQETLLLLEVRPQLHMSGWHTLPSADVQC